MLDLTHATASDAPQISPMSRVHRRWATAFAILFLSFIVLKYYPLRPSMFATSQYLWPYGANNFRRGVLSTLAGLLHGFDPERIVPVVEFFSVVQMICLAGLAWWAWPRLSRHRIVIVASILSIASGLVPQLLAARGSQDGFVLLIVVLFGVALHRHQSLVAALVGIAAVAVHEAALPYLVSVVLLHMALSKTELSPTCKSSLRQDWIGPVARASLIVAPSVLVASLAVFLTHVDPQTIEAVCSHYKSLESFPFNDMTSHMSKSDINFFDWFANCGVQFRHYQGSITFFVRSIFLGLLFAPVVIFFVVLTVHSSYLSTIRKIIVIASAILPAMLALVAYDTTRFWSYMNVTALYGVFLLEGLVCSTTPNLATNPAGKLRETELFTLLFASIWLLLSIVVYLGPTDWERQQTVLPASLEAKFPTFRNLFCNLSQSGLCYKPFVDVR